MRKRLEESWFLRGYAVEQNSAYGRKIGSWIATIASRYSSLGKREEWTLNRLALFSQWCLFLLI